MNSNSIEKDELITAVDDEMEEVWQNQTYIPFRVGIRSARPIMLRNVALCPVLCVVMS
jgi:hypothetical protein